MEPEPDEEAISEQAREYMKSLLAGVEDVPCDPAQKISRYYDVAKIFLDKGFELGAATTDMDKKCLAYIYFMRYANMGLHTIPRHPRRNTAAPEDKQIQRAIPKIIDQMEKWKVQIKDDYVRQLKERQQQAAQKRQAAAAVAPPAASPAGDGVLGGPDASLLDFSDFGLDGDADPEPPTEPAAAARTVPPASTSDLRRLREMTGDVSCPAAWLVWPKPLGLCLLLAKPELLWAALRRPGTCRWPPHCREICPSRCFQARPPAATLRRLASSRRLTNGPSSRARPVLLDGAPSPAGTRVPSAPRPPTAVLASTSGWPAVCRRARVLPPLGRHRRRTTQRCNRHRTAQPLGCTTARHRRPRRHGVRHRGPGRSHRASCSRRRGWRRRVGSRCRRRSAAWLAGWRELARQRACRQRRTATACQSHRRSGAPSAAPCRPPPDRGPHTTLPGRAGQRRSTQGEVGLCLPTSRRRRQPTPGLAWLEFRSRRSSAPWQRPMRPGVPARLPPR